MKRIGTLILICFTFLAYSQDFPKEMQLSSDGTRLQLGGHATTGFYNESKIRIIELTFPNDNFWAEITAAGDNDVMASVTIDGAVFDSVGVRFKGATSDFRNDSEKKSFNISMDAFIDGQDVKGYETLNLNGNYEDPSSIREILYNHVGRNYTNGLKTNFAQLYINGIYWGPYENVQQLNGEFMREWFMSNDGTRWRAMQEGALTGGGGPGGGGPGGGPGGGGPGGGGPGGGGGGGNFGQGESTLNFLGEAEAYIPNYTLKKTSKENPWVDLASGTEQLNLLPTDNDLYDNLKNYLDIDKALWFLAHEILFTDADGYISKGGMDYYVYWEAETGRLVPLEYDGNSVMQFPNTNIWTPFYRENETDFPLANRLFASPDLRQRYLAHFRVILADHFTPTYLDELIDNYAAQIRSSIEADTKRITEPAEFEAELINLKNHVRERRDFLLSHSEMGAEGLTIADVSTLTTAPASNETVTITTTISDENGIDKVRLYYGAGLVGTFDRVEMMANGDGTYSATIPNFSAGTYVRYYVEAIAADEANTATYAPRGAEHDVYVYRVNVGTIEESDVVINEFMASNDATVADQDEEFDDWIELFNTTNSDIDLTGYFLSDNSENLDKYDIPDGTIISANGYLIVWADEDGMQEGLHANFKLSAGGEELFLVNPDTLVIDEITFGEQQTDVAYARIPNGIGAFDFKTPTFMEHNEGGTTNLNEVDFDTNLLLVSPNPANTYLSLQLQNSTERAMEVKLFDAYGRLVLQQLNGATNMEINIQSLGVGLYFVVVNERVGQKVIIAR
ncbi:MAG: CotH kinase family protein [Saprospiraceae bacterium]